MARQRNNISRLPAAVRARVSDLLDDGATYDEVRRDPEVAAELSRRRASLHDTSFQAWIQGQEHQGHVAARRRYAAEIERRRLAAHIVTEGGASDDAARVASYEILRQVLSRLESGEGEIDARELSALASSLGAYERARAAEAAEERRRQDQRLRSRIAELEARVRELTAEREAAEKGDAAPKALTEEQAAEIRARLGIR